MNPSESLAQRTPHARARTVQSQTSHRNSSRPARAKAKLSPAFPATNSSLVPRTSLRSLLHLHHSRAKQLFRLLYEWVLTHIDGWRNAGPNTHRSSSRRTARQATSQTIRRSLSTFRANRTARQLHTLATLEHHPHRRAVQPRRDGLDLLQPASRHRQHRLRNCQRQHIPHHRHKRDALDHHAQPPSLARHAQNLTPKLPRRSRTARTRCHRSFRRRRRNADRGI